MTPRQRALHTLIDRCAYVRANMVQSGIQDRTKPTEWQPVIWVDWVSIRAKERAGA